jgi:hypothetical protein
MSDPSISSTSGINTTVSAPAVDPQQNVQAQKALTETQQQEQIARQEAAKKAAAAVEAQKQQQEQEAQRVAAQKRAESQVQGTKGGNLNVFA